MTASARDLRFALSRSLAPPPLPKSRPCSRWTNCSARSSANRRWSGHAGVDEAPADQPPLADAPITGRLPPAVDSWPAELAAIPELDDVALGSGLINARPDSDGVIRSVPLVMRAGGKPRPASALEIARNALGAETHRGDALQRPVGGRAVPIDRHGRMRLHFGQLPAGQDRFGRRSARQGRSASSRDLSPASRCSSACPPKARRTLQRPRWPPRNLGR